jgi:hypothetical protein
VSCLPHHRINPFLLSSKGDWGHRRQTANSGRLSGGGNSWAKTYRMSKSRVRRLGGDCISAEDME